MSQVPDFVSFIFVLTVLFTIYFFGRAARSRPIVIILTLVWIVLQSIVGRAGFYTLTTTTPPRLLLMLLPPLLFILGLFLTKKGKQFLDGLDIRWLTLLHLVRLPVEIVLLFLYLHAAIPRLMTFEGANFDILSGISAPFIVYWSFTKKSLRRTYLLAWNILCLLLLFNIVMIAVLSAPFPFQQWAFDQPNIAILYFPYNLLPAYIVPVVLLSHLASIRQLSRKK